MGDAAAGFPVLMETIQKNLEVLLYNYTLSLDKGGGGGGRGGGDEAEEAGGGEEDVLADLADLGVDGEEGGGGPGGNGSGPWGNGSVPRYTVPRLSAEIQIVLYALIFLLAVAGNLLVIVTLFQNKRMRTVTNVFLLNLALSDLLLAVFCMPFTLVPVLLRNFIFGAAMCVLLRYLQGEWLAASGPFWGVFVCRWVGG